MKLDPFSENLLSFVKEDYHLSEQTLERFRHLTEEGVELEQLLVAGSILGVAQYFALLELVSGMPVVKTPVSSLSLDFFSDDDVRRFQAIPFQKHKNGVFVAFASPRMSCIHSVRNILRKKNLKLFPFVIPKALYKKSIQKTKEQYLHAVVDQLFSQFEEMGLSQVYFMRQGLAVHILNDAYYSIPDIFLAPELFSACILYLRRKPAKLDWSIMKDSPEISSIYHVARHAPYIHPLTWLEKEALPDDEYPMVIFVRPDAFSREQLQPIGEYTHISDWNQGTRKYLIENHKDQELAMHAVLAGNRVVAVCKNDDVWWRDLSDAGYPIKIVKSILTPRARAWEVYSH